MNPYQQLYESGPTDEQLTEIKGSLQSGTAGASWESYYWGTKCLVKYDQEDFEPALLAGTMNMALKYGLSYKSNKEAYLDAVKILGNAYSQMSQYDLVTNCLGSILELEDNPPDWVYHDFISAQNRTGYIKNNLRRPQMFLSDLSHNDSGSGATRKKQQNIFREFLAAGILYLSQNRGAQVDVDTLSNAVKEYDITDSVEWKTFIDICNGKCIEIPTQAISASATNVGDSSAETGAGDNSGKVAPGSRPLVISLFPEAGADGKKATQDDIQQKYDALMQKFTRMQEELQQRNAELEQQTQQAEAKLAEKDQKLAEVSSSLVSLQQMNDDLQKSIEQHNDDMKAYEAEIDAKDQEIAEIQELLSSAQQGSSKKKELQKQVKIATAQRDEMKTRYEALKGTLEESKEKLKTATEQIRSTDQENKALKSEVEKLKKANARPMSGSKAAQIIGEYSKYIFITAQQLSKWLTTKLQSYPDWWEECVMSKLSNEQAMYATSEHYDSLDAFDLAALLRILSKNWKRLEDKYYWSYSDKNNLDQMFKVRNKWAHFNTTPPSKYDMVYYLNTISGFLGFLDADSAIIQEVDRFKTEVVKMDLEA